MPQLTYTPVDDNEKFEVVKSHPSGVLLQRAATGEYCVVFNGVCFVKDHSQTEVETIYLLVLRMTKGARPKTMALGPNWTVEGATAAPPPVSTLTAEEIATAMDKLKNFVGVYNDTVAHRLLQDGKGDDVKKMLDKNAALYRLADADGDTLLHIACRAGNLDFVRFLFNAAKKDGFYREDGGETLFDPNARNNARWTPLHCAAFGFHFKICDILLKEAPVAVNCITEPNHSTPLHFLARFQDANELMSAGSSADGSSSTLSSSMVYSRPAAASVSSRENLILTPSNASATSLASVIAPNSQVLKDMLEVLMGLLDAGADLSTRDAKGETPLHIAANLGSVVVAEWLVLNRADVNATSFLNLETPLHMAIRGRNPVIVEMLLGANADVFASSKLASSLDLSAQFSSPEITKLLKEHIKAISTIDGVSEPISITNPPQDPNLTSSGSIAASPNSTQSVSPQTGSPTMVLANMGVPGSTRVLVSKKLDEVLAQQVAADETGPVVTSMTSLIQDHVALSAPLPATSAPITMGTASTSTQESQSASNSGESAMSLQTILPSIAALPLYPFKQLRRVVEATLFSPGKSPLHEAVILNNDRLVAEILRVRPNLINSKDQQRWTPILYAAAYGHIGLIIRLTRSGADLSVTDADDSGILHFLARNRRVGDAPLEFSDLLDVLLLHGLNLDLYNMFGATALHEAASRNNLVVLQSLCQRGAKVDAVTKLGESPLIYAARENCVDAVNYLLHRGANMDLVGKYGSAVDIARNYCNVSVLKVFLFYKTISDAPLYPIDSLRPEIPGAFPATPAVAVTAPSPYQSAPSIGNAALTTPAPTAQTMAPSAGAPKSNKLPTGRRGSVLEPFAAPPGGPQRPVTPPAPLPISPTTPGSVSMGAIPRVNSMQASSSNSAVSSSGSASMSSLSTPKQSEKLQRPQPPSMIPQSLNAVGNNKASTSSPGTTDDEVAEMEETDLSDPKKPEVVSFSSFLSPRRHLTVSVEGNVIDYNKVYEVYEPLLAAFPCTCTITSPMAVFKDTQGFVIVWQHYVAFGHVAATSSGALVADSSFNWKVSFSNVLSVSLVKAMFSANRITISASSTASDIPDTTISLFYCERLEALERLLQYLFTNRTAVDRLEINGAPLVDMVGQILYPKETGELHKALPQVANSETVLDYFTCTYKEEGTFASKLVFVSQHRLLYGRRNLAQIAFEDVKTIKKAESKTIIFETPNQKYTFTRIDNRDSAFSLIEALWNAQQSDNRVVIFGALGRRTMQLTELFIEKYTKTTGGSDIYIRWVLIQGYHVLDRRQQDMLRDIGVEVIWLSSRNGYTVIPEILQYMRKVALFYLDFDPKFLEVAEMILRHCAPRNLKQIMLISLALGNQASYFSDSVSQLQDMIRNTEVSFVFIQSHPAFMQILEDEFINIKRDWRFRLPWPGTMPKLAWLDMRDVVDVAVEICAAKNAEIYNNKYYFIAGPESLSCDDIAGAITQLTEQEVRFIGVSMDEIKQIQLQSLADTTLSGRKPEGAVHSLSRTVSMDQYLPAIVTHDVSEIHTFAAVTNSELVKSLQSKLAMFDPNGTGFTPLNFDTQQFMLIFGDLLEYNMHAIPSTLTCDLTGRRPRTIQNFVIDHLESFRAKGAYNFTQAQKDTAQRHFLELADSLSQAAPGRIDAGQSAKLFSPFFAANAPSFTQRLARAFNPDSRSHFSVSDFVRTCSIFVNGDPKDQLLLASEIFDSDHDQLINSQDIADVGAEIVALLGTLGIEYNAFSVRTLLSAKGLTSYPREAPLPQPKYNASQAGVPLASALDRPLRSELSVSEFCHILKVNRLALATLGCLAVLPSQLSDKVHTKQKRNGIYVYPVHPLWETSLRLSVGISRSIQAQMTEGTSQRGEATEADCALETEYLVSGPTEPEPWTFMEYGDVVFRKIRDACGVTAPDFLASLGIEVTLGNLLLGKLANFEEISSSGRSGSFFLRSHNTKFLIKSLPLDEATFLRKNLWKYYRHIRDYPDTLLARFFGLYRVKSSSKGETYFVIMANLFDSPLEVHEQYDLKGSTVNRYVGDKMQFWSANIAMKDLDFHRFISIGPERKALFVQQAEIDAIFMETFNICDYSLLVGFHFSDSANVDASHPRSPMGSFGFMVGSTSRPEEYITYYLCNLIDILTQYNLKKRGESAFKSLVHRKSQISAISPNPYRKRFVRYIISILR